MGGKATSAVEQRLAYIYSAVSSRQRSLVRSAPPPTLVHSAAVWAPRVVRAGLAAVSGYLGILTAAALASSRRPRSAVRSSVMRRYSVLVPAHDEAQLIATTVESLLALDY